MQLASVFSSRKIAPDLGAWGDEEVSVHSIQHDIVSLQHEISRLNDKLASSRQKYAKAVQKSVNATAKLHGKNSVSKIESLNREITRAQGGQSREAKIQGNITKSLGQKKNKLAGLQTRLSKETKKEHQASLEQLSQGYDRQLNQIRQQQIHSFTDRQHELVNEQRQFDVFISYAHVNEQYVNGLNTDLKQAGIKVWIDSDELAWGGKLT